MAVLVLALSTLACARSARDDLRDSPPDLRVFLRHDVTDVQQERILEEIERTEETETVFFESRQQAYERFKEWAREQELGDELIQNVDRDSFYDAYCVYMTNGAPARRLIQEISNFPGVLDVRQHPQGTPPPAFDSAMGTASGC
ncbi:MAG TPA: permease-like cell division protein FtsX [Actinomycetota bacterium]|nr:permease-like cell division protein FtsX [Actinomycetota bacterium]